MKLWKKMLLGLLLGTVTGIILGPYAVYLKPFGTIFLGLLNMVVVLLVFSSMAAGVTSINDVKKLGRVGLKTLLMYLLTTAVAIILAAVMAKIVNPGRGIHLGSIETKIAVEATTPSLLNLFLDLVPSNPLGALANGNILQVIFFAIFLGIAINFAGEKGKPLARGLEALSDVMFSMTKMIMNFAPYGVFAIMAWVAGSFGIAVLWPLLKLVLAHYFTCTLHLILIYGGILFFMAKVKIRPFFKGMSEAMTLAASTTSSSATMPVTLHCVKENLGVSKNIANFSIPLGTTINMNGTAIFQGLATVFIAQAYGIELGWQNLLIIVITGTFAAVGCAGIPGGGLVTLSIVLGSVGLPLEGIAIVAGIDRLRDIVGTVTNVLGDAVVAVYVAKSEGEFDEKTYNNEKYISYEEEKKVRVGA